MRPMMAVMIALMTTPATTSPTMTKIPIVFGLTRLQRVARPRVHPNGSGGGHADDAH